MSFIYPDNQHRYDRVTGLATNIGSIQQEVLDAIQREDDKNVQINITMNQLLAKYGLQTIDQMKDRVLATLTPEQKQSFLDMVNAMKGKDGQVDKVLDASFMIGFIAGLAALVVPRVVTLLNTGALVAGLDLVGRGFVRILRGAFAEGVAMIGAGVRTGRLLATNVELGADASRFVRIFRAGARVLAVISVVLDAIVLIYQAIEGARQREELRNAITELFARRLNVKTLEQQVFNVESYQGEVQGYMATANILQPGPGTDQILQQFADTIIQHIKDGMAKITDQTVYDQLHNQDVASNAWTNEDPSLAQTLEWIAKQPDTPSS